MSDYNSLDLLHKQQIVFNATMLEVAVKVLAKCGETSKTEIIQTLVETSKEVFDGLSDTEINALVNQIELQLQKEVAKAETFLN